MSACSGKGKQLLRESEAITTNLLTATVQKMRYPENLSDSSNNQTMKKTQEKQKNKMNKGKEATTKTKTIMMVKKKKKKRKKKKSSCAHVRMRSIFTSVARLFPRITLEHVQRICTPSSSRAGSGSNLWSLRAYIRRRWSHGTGQVLKSFS